MSRAAVLFDLDGTLVDSAPAIRGVAARFLAGQGAEPLSLAETRAFIGHGAEAFLERMLAARGLGPRTDADLARFLDLYARAPGAENIPYPGVAAALKAFRAAGMPIGLCTNKPRAAVLPVLRAHGWEGLFATLVAGGDLPVKKPDPAPLLHAAAALGAEPAACLYVGDSEVDRDTASAAGMPFALWLHGYRQDPAEAFPGAHLLGDWAGLPALALGD